jgi:hypothetical protein
MNDFEYVEIMSKEESKEFFNMLYTKNKDKNDISEKYLEEHIHELLDAAHSYEQKVIKEFRERKTLALKEKIAWQKKNCMHCSAPLKLVHGDYGDFYGCPNYRNGGEHSKFSTNSEEVESRLNYRIFNSKAKINAHWLTDLKVNLKMPSFVPANLILTSLKANGFDDLRLKFGYKATIESISSYPTAKKLSAIEEKEITDFFSVYFPKVVFQQGIRYKRKNEAEKKRFIDLIVSDEKNVNIIEIKRDILSLNHEQLSLYFDLIQYIRKRNNDHRRLQSLFVVSNSIVTLPLIGQPKNRLFFLRHPNF